MNLDEPDSLVSENLFSSEINSNLQEYTSYLEKKGHKPDYVTAQKEFIEFFAKNYMYHYNGQSLLDIDTSFVEDFLEDWCIRKVLDFNKSSILPYLRSFKKFFMFLRDTKKITSAEYDNFKQLNKNPRKFVERVERYENLNPYSESWDEDYEKWCFNADIKKEADYRKDMINFLESDKQLIEKISRIDAGGLKPIINDFDVFIDHISSYKKGLTLTNGLFNLKRKDLLKLNSAFSHPEELPKTVKQQDTVLLHFFYLVSKRLGLCRYTKTMSLTSTALHQDFSDLSQPQKYCFLFRGLWDKINWISLNEYSTSGRPEWFFADRYIFPPYFSLLEVNRWITYKQFKTSFPKYLYENGYSLKVSDNSLYFYGVFHTKILPLFSSFGLFDLNQTPPFSYAKFDNLKVRLTSLGKIVFSELQPTNLPR